MKAVIRYFDTEKWTYKTKVIHSARRVRTYQKIAQVLNKEYLPIAEVREWAWWELVDDDHEVAASD